METAANVRCVRLQIEKKTNVEFRKGNFKLNKKQRNEQNKSTKKLNER